MYLSTVGGQWVDRQILTIPLAGGREVATASVCAAFSLSIFIFIFYVEGPLVIVSDAGDVAVETTLDINNNRWRIQTHSRVNKQGDSPSIGY